MMCPNMFRLDGAERELEIDHNLVVSWQLESIDLESDQLDVCDQTHLASKHDAYLGSHIYIHI